MPLVAACHDIFFFSKPLFTQKEKLNLEKRIAVPYWIYVESQ